MRDRERERELCAVCVRCAVCMYVYMYDERERMRENFHRKQGRSISSSHQVPLFFPSLLFSFIYELFFKFMYLSYKFVMCGHNYTTHYSFPIIFQHYIGIVLIGLVLRCHVPDHFLYSDSIVTH